MFPVIPDHLKSDRTNPFEGSIPTWSYSRLSTFLKCPYSALLSNKGHRGEQHPAAARGVKIHEDAEAFIIGTTDKLAKELKKFEEDFVELRDLFLGGSATAEEKWAWEHDWSPCEFDAEKRWGRGIVDAFVQEDISSVRVIDFKSGRNQGVEVSHGRQIMYYSLAALARDLNIEFVTSELWYLDHGTKTEKSFTRKQLMQFLPDYTRRALDMTECSVFLPKPSNYACRWCDHKKSGVCEYAS